MSFFSFYYDLSQYVYRFYRLQQTVSSDMFIKKPQSEITQFLQDAATTTTCHGKDGLGSSDFSAPSDASDYEDRTRSLVRKLRLRLDMDCTMWCVYFVIAKSGRRNILHGYFWYVMSCLNTFQYLNSSGTIFEQNWTAFSGGVPLVESIRWPGRQGMRNSCKRFKWNMQPYRKMLGMWAKCCPRK